MMSLHDSSRRAFTLIELLVVMAVIALLVGILLPALGAARARARGLACLTQMRTIGQAMTLYVHDFNDHFPSTNHVGFGGGPDWDVQLSTYLGFPSVYHAVVGGDFYLEDNSDAVQYYNTLLRCPEDDRHLTGEFSYGQNVYFNLDPHAGDPAEAAMLDGRRWNRLIDLPAPSATVIYSEIQSSSNHLMAHYWTYYNTPTSEVVARHLDRTNFVFADGHAFTGEFAETYDQSVPRDNWNPATAR